MPEVESIRRDSSLESVFDTLYRLDGVCGHYLLSKRQESPSVHNVCLTTLVELSLNTSTNVELLSMRTGGLGGTAFYLNPTSVCRSTIL